MAANYVNGFEFQRPGLKVYELCSKMGPEFGEYYPKKDATDYLPPSFRCSGFIKKKVFRTAVILSASPTDTRATEVLKLNAPFKVLISFSHITWHSVTKNKFKKCISLSSFLILFLNLFNEK